MLYRDTIILIVGGNRSTKIYFLLTILALAFGAMYVAACGPAEGGDDDESADDNAADDDSSGDDEEGYCEAGLIVVYNCGLYLVDDEGSYGHYEEIIVFCNTGDQFVICVAACGLTVMDCDELWTCIAENCG